MSVREYRNIPSFDVDILHTARLFYHQQRTWNGGDCHMWDIQTLEASGDAQGMFRTVPQYQSCLEIQLATCRAEIGWNFGARDTSQWGLYGSIAQSLFIAINTLCPKKCLA